MSMCSWNIAVDRAALVCVVLSNFAGWVPKVVLGEVPLGFRFADADIAWHAVSLR
jgi:hypothetical protein